MIPFEVGHRVKPVKWTTHSGVGLQVDRNLGGGEIVSIEGNVAIVRFDGLLHFRPVLQELAWRIERLEFEHTAEEILGEEYWA